MLERLIAYVSVEPLAYTQSVTRYWNKHPTSLRSQIADRTMLTDAKTTENIVATVPLALEKKIIDGNFNVSSGD